MAEHDPLLQEINEAVRQERYTRLWDRYRFHLFGVIGALVLVTAGFSVERELTRQNSAAFTKELVTAQKLMETEKYEEAANAFAQAAEKQSGERQAIARLWQATAQRASGAPEAANGTLRSYAEQADASLWRDIACIQLFGSESIPAACSGASEGGFAALMRTQTASQLAMDGEWEKAEALMGLVAADARAPRALQAQADLWRDMFAAQHAMASMEAMRKEGTN